MDLLQCHGHYRGLPWGQSTIRREFRASALSRLGRATAVTTHRLATLYQDKPLKDCPICAINLDGALHTNFRGIAEVLMRCLLRSLALRDTISYNPTMKKKVALGAVGVCALIAAFSTFQFGYLNKRADDARPFPVSLIPTGSEPKTYSWHFKDGPYNETTHTPSVAVMLTLDEKSYDVGTYDGHCVEIGNSMTPLRYDERVAAQCWHGDQGDEIAVLLDQGKLVIEHALLNKTGVVAQDFRGEFTPLFEI